MVHLPWPFSSMVVLNNFWANSTILGFQLYSYQAQSEFGWELGANNVIQAYFKSISQDLCDLQSPMIKKFSL